MSKPLDLWPEPARGRLLTMAEHVQPGRDFAVFDADGTLWDGDLIESVVARLELAGALTPETLDPALRVLPFEDGEDLYGHYLRVTEFQHDLGFAWIDRAIGGLSVDQVSKALEAVLDDGQPTPRVVDGEPVHAVRIRPAMQQLVSWLNDIGVAVYIVTAGLAELARMVVSDPERGLPIDLDRVIGIELLMRDADGAPTLGRWPGAAGYRDHRYTGHIAGPTIWRAGKWAAVLQRIDPARRPMAAGGDTLNDFEMLQGVDIDRGGCRIWVGGRPASTRLEQAISQRQKALHDAGRAATADQGWLKVAPDTLGRPPGR